MKEITKSNVYLVAILHKIIKRNPQVRHTLELYSDNSIRFWELELTNRDEVISKKPINPNFAKGIKWDFGYDVVIDESDNSLGYRWHDFRKSNLIERIAETLLLS